MATVPIDLAATQLPELFARAEAGEDVVIAKGGGGVRLVPTSLPPAGKRQPGTWKGRVSIPASFWEPLPDEWTGWPGDAAS